MKPKYGDFTRGSQLIETFGMMFAAGLRPMLWVIGTLFSVSLGFLIWNDMESGDLYRCAMRFYSWFWDYLKLDPGKLVNVVGPGNTPVQNARRAGPRIPASPAVLAAAHHHLYSGVAVHGNRRAAGVLRLHLGLTVDRPAGAAPQSRARCNHRSRRRAGRPYRRLQQRQGEGRTRGRISAALRPVLATEGTAGHEEGAARGRRRTSPTPLPAFPIRGAPNRPICSASGRPAPASRQ